MKRAKYIVFTLMSALLALTVVMGYVVFDHASDLILPFLSQGGDTAQKPSSFASVPSSPSTPSVPDSSIPTIHQCDFVNKSSTYAPTCDALGYTIYVCECGRVDYKDYVPALGHEFGEYTVVPPTCTEDGWTERTCGKCGMTERTHPVEAGHKFGDPITERNYEKHICGVCGFIEQYSTESGPVWKMEISTLEPLDSYTHLQVLLDLNGGDEEYTFDIYMGIPDQIPAFDYLNGYLVVYYDVAGESTQCGLLTGTNVLTIRPDGTPVMEAPTPAEPAE